MPVIGILALLLMMVLVILVVAGGIALVMLLVRRGQSQTGESGTCGKCGYRVTGLTTFSCPECGADLREVGIAKTNTNNGLLVGLVVAGSVSLVLLCGCFGVGFVGWNAPAPAIPVTVTSPAAPAPVESDSEPAEGGGEEGPLPELDPSRPVEVDNN